MAGIIMTIIIVIAGAFARPPARLLPAGREIHLR